MKALFVMLALAAGFANAKLPWSFAFPRDHAAHDAFASEWWYYTGHLTAPDGRRFGYELTFFRIGMRPGAGTPAPGQSRWRGNELYPAHFALTDERGKRFFYAERFERAALGMGAASTRALAVRVDDWTLAGGRAFHLHAQDAGTAIDLDAAPLKPPAIHGHDGVSVKGACATCASHYYSMTRLRTTGTLRYDGETLTVNGISWMDHEFGSGQLEPQQTGWDWFSLQLTDGRDLMLYRLRERDGTTTPQSSGSLIERDGRVRHLPLAAFRTTATGSWRSPHDGAVYPMGWRVQVPSARLDVALVPVLEDQELSRTTGGVSYWEGAVDVRDPSSGRALGVGYVELTGYAGSIAL